MTTQIICVAVKELENSDCDTSRIRDLLSLRDSDLAESSFRYYRTYLDRWTMAGHDIKRIALKSNASWLEDNDVVGFVSPGSSMSWLTSEYADLINKAQYRESVWLLDAIRDALAIAALIPRPEVMVVAKVLGVSGNE